MPKQYHFNNLVTGPPFGWAVASGGVDNHLSIGAFGAGTDFDIADGSAVVWDGMSLVTKIPAYTFSATADIDSLSSSSASDTTNILVRGLDEDWNEVDQILTLNGQTRVALTTPLIRITRMVNDGAVGFVGNVFCYVNGAITAGVPNTDADVRAIIAIGNNQTLMAVFSVPSGRRALMTSIVNEYTARKTGAATYKLKTRDFGKTFVLQHIGGVSFSGSSHATHLFEPPLVLEEKTDIIMESETNVDTTSFSSSFNGIQIEG